MINVLFNECRKIYKSLAYGMKKLEINKKVST